MVRTSINVMYGVFGVPLAWSRADTSTQSIMRTIPTTTGMWNLLTIATFRAELHTAV